MNRVTANTNENLCACVYVCVFVCGLVLSHNAGYPVDVIVLCLSVCVFVFTCAWVRERSTCVVNII